MVVLNKVSNPKLLPTLQNFQMGSKEIYTFELKSTYKDFLQIRQADGDNQITFRWHMIVKKTSKNRLCSFLLLEIESLRDFLMGKNAVLNKVA